MALNLPDGSTCFIDANIIYYHFVDTPGLSDPCSDLIERIVDDRVAAFTSIHLLAEAVHKIMLSEVAKRFGMPRARLVNWLQNNSDRIADLDEFRLAVSEFASLNIGLLPLDIPLLVAGTELSKQLGLLTNDALTVALLHRHGIVNLVTNDGDFEHVPGITVWKPD